MSFGLEDRDWVDPDEEEPARCSDCDEWRRCPCDCGYGWCERSDCFTWRDDEC